MAFVTAQHPTAEQPFTRSYLMLIQHDFVAQHFILVEVR